MTRGLGKAYRAYSGLWHEDQYLSHGPARLQPHFCSSNNDVPCILTCILLRNKFIGRVRTIFPVDRAQQHTSGKIRDQL